MESTHQMVLQVELGTEDEPISGLVRASDGRPYPFSGWSELFAVLRRLTAEPGEMAETEENP